MKPASYLARNITICQCLCFQPLLPYYPDGFRSPLYYFNTKLQSFQLSKNILKPSSERPQSVLRVSSERPQSVLRASSENPQSFLRASKECPWRDLKATSKRPKSVLRASSECPQSHKSITTAKYQLCIETKNRLEVWSKNCQIFDSLC